MIRINDLKCKATLRAAAVMTVFLLFAAVAGFAQQQINLTAAPTTTTLPDGTTVPMWGYFCGTAVTGSTATCGPLNPSSLPPAGSTAPATWSPVLITVPTGQGLTINLTNSLTFQPPTPTGGTAPAPNTIPTSIVMVGQVGGGLGASSTSTPSPNHTNVQGCPTWFIASLPPGTPCTTQIGAGTANNVSGTPPAQGPRVQSMAQEVAEGTTATALTWANLKPGTYLLESGTHPSIQVPMGLIGMLVVTQVPTSSGATAGVAYPAVSGLSAAVPYTAELPLEFSEIDPVQNKEVDRAVRTAGFNESAVWTQMNTGSITALTLTSQGVGYTSAPTVGFTGGGGGGAAATATLGYGVASVAVTNGGSGYLTAPTVTFAGGGSSDGAATATLAAQFSGVTIASGGTGYSVGNALSFTGGGAPTTPATGSVSAISTGVLSVAVTAGTTAYTAPTVTFSGGGGSGAAATATASGTTVTVTVTSPGSGYTSAPTVTINDPTGTGASATATLLPTGAIAGVTVSAGAGYTLAPTIGVTAGTAASVGTGAVLVASFPVATVAVTSGGAYASVPAVQFTGGGGTGAVATATLSTTTSLALTITNAGGGFTGVPTVTFTGGGATTAATATATIGAGGCGVAYTCYPPAVNYTPFYYLVDGVAFSKANPTLSLFQATAGMTTCTVGTVTTPCPATTGIPATGTILARLVNAGLRMHVPSIVGSQTQGFNGAGTAATVAGFTLIAEDGNVIPGVAPAGAATVPAAPRVQTHVFMPASKTFDVLLNIPAVASGGTVPPSLPIYSRDLALSANSSVRDAGMLAYIGVNGAGLPVTPGATGSVFAVAQANPDAYPSLVAGQTFTISDPSKGVLANDVNVYGATLLSGPTSGTLSCGAMSGVMQTTVSGICANGTFTYTPNAGSTATTDSFTYCGNNGYVAPTGTATVGTCTTTSATVTLTQSALTGGPSAINQAYTASTATYIKIAPPGLLAGNSDPSNLPISVSSSSLLACAAPVTAVCGTVDPNGGFLLTFPAPTTPPTAATTQSFTYSVQNSQGRTSPTGTVTITFPVPSNLKVNVLDAQQYKNCNGNNACISALTPMPDYRWIIEEDQTLWVDPNCTTNSSITTLGCPAPVASGATIASFGTQFHTSFMPYVIQGCTGPMSCEGGQTMLDTRPVCTNPPTNTIPAGCSATAGQHIYAICDVGAGACRPDPNQTTGSGFTPVNPSEVVLDPTKRYYISVLPGDAANPFPAYLGQPTCTNGTNTTAATYSATCGHTMSGAPIPPACNILLAGCTSASTAAFAPVNVLVLPTPLPTGKLSVIVFEDDFPLNGEQDGGGGNGTIAPIEPGLGGFNLVLWDTYGGLGDITGQDTYDDFNQPLSNSLSGTIDPVTGLDACPVSANATSGPAGAGSAYPTPPSGPAPLAGGITSMIVTCPKFESDNHTLSPLAGQAVIANLMPDKFSVQAYPGADRISRGEQWVQTNTLDGQHAHDSFIRVGEPSYFQEYGPAGYHVAIGFANPAIINARAGDVCAGLGTPGIIPVATGGTACTNIITGQVDVQRLSRTPDQRLYPSGSRDGLIWTQCWVSLGDPDGEDFMFQFCDAAGNFKFTGVPNGNWRITMGDQWNDQIIDGLSLPANVGCSPNGALAGQTTTCAGGQTLPLGNIASQQWQANLYTRTFIDVDKSGVWKPQNGDIGIPFIYTMIHYRDGHTANNLVTDFNGVANFNETYPLFNWYVVEADSGRYKTTGIHSVYDAGGPADGSSSCGNGTTARQCGNTGTLNNYNFLSNTWESVPLPGDLSVPGAVYCHTADCGAEWPSFKAGTPILSSSAASTGRIDPPWVWAEGWAGLTGQSNWIDFGKAPYAACPPTCVITGSGTTATTTTWGENGGIHGYVGYAGTRPFDDASQMIQQPWVPNVPRVTVNLYQEGFAADGVTPTLTLVDTTVSASWDDWAQGFWPSTTAGTGTGAGEKPYMSCPGQGIAPTAAGTTQPPNADPFFFTLYDQPNFLNYYKGLHSTPQVAPTVLPYNSQYKCYDSMHIGNQIQPAFYDGKYFFPSVLGITQSGRLNTALTGGVVGGSSPNPTTGITTASMGGTNCTVCVPNPDITDPYRVGTPMLPPGKYVVQVVMPPGYEVYKEEDKNLLIGDNFIAPVTQQFAGLGTYIYIIPDQASVASLYEPGASGYNPNDFQNQTTGLGLNEELSGVPGFPGFQDPLWPCVGTQRVVPDYLSIYPLAHEAGPFAGATRPLCDRKEVIVQNQMSVSVKFFIFTSTHIASKYAGGITDDYTSEFDPFSPQFGEKFAPPNMPVSTRDYLGNEISRVYSDHWGTYNGLTFSSWEVNPPNITGYSPSMMVQCMNDPGPILDTRTTIPNPLAGQTGQPATIPNPTLGQTITDPLFNANYSNFCYEQPFMPGLTNYADTPVVPTAAFIGAAYNSPDCSYPDATPAIAEVDGDQVGPWVSAGGNTLTITALGNQLANNSAYSGPSASVAPFNNKTVNRHYGFGTQCLTPTAGSTTCNTLSQVTIGGAQAVVSSWSDTAITVTVPTTGIPNCPIQQQMQYGGPGTTGVTTALCGQLIITAGNGKQSIDTVTVTVGGKAPFHHVAANESIQSWIDQAAPGDLLIIDPTCSTIATTATPSTNQTCSTAGLHAATPTQTAAVASHQEMLIMWKPVRLQGVGAATSVINANAQPAGTLLSPWRRHIVCLFGLTLQGVPIGSTTGTGGTNSYDPTNSFKCPDAGWNYFSGSTLGNPQIDRLPLEAILGWDATLNGNLAEQLQEPSLMGAYEGSGITVLGKGVEYHGASPWTDGNEGGAFPTTTTLLTGVGPSPLALPTGDANNYCHTLNDTGTTLAAGVAEAVMSQTNPYPSNFMCNPSSIDGLTITNSSQGGGGIFAHGWAHHLQIANNRVYNNAGTLTGGISVGQGEFPTAYIQGSATNAAPGSCSDGTGFVANQHLPYCLELQVNVHHNFVSNNSSLGDELFSGTLAGAGGVTFCTGNDYYLFDYNWVCGNLSSGEGGGVVHLGEIQYGDIEHNSILLNQSTNPTIPTNGGGIMVQGTPDTDPVCGTAIDADCPPGLSDGIGHNLVINANLIQANMAESGSGGGIRLQQVNGTDVSTFPGTYAITAADEGHTVTITTAGTLPAVGDLVTVTGVTVAGYNGVGLTVNHVGIGFFTYLAPTTGLAIGASGTYTDTTAAGTAQTILSAVEAAPTKVTILSTLSPSVGDTVVISGLAPTAYDGTYVVTSVPAGAGSFTYTDATTGLTAGTVTGATVIDSNQSSMKLWNSVFITNNMIVNNLAGWDGAGISLQDALNVAIINNTIVSNDTLASSGVLTQSLGAPDTSAPAGSCLQAGLTTSCPQSAGVTTTLNSSILTTTFTGLTIACPFSQPNCTGFSNPLLENNVIWQNRAFYLGVSTSTSGPTGTGTLNQQNLVTLYPTIVQTASGQCTGTPSYWDIGVRGDSSATPNSGSGFALNPQYSVLTSTSGYATTNSAANPSVVTQYCNGSRVPPECTVADGCAGPNGYGVPPGIVDASSPNPVFTLTPSATVDEGNNWINVSWGPLALSNDALAGGLFGNYGGGSMFGNYALNAGSPAIDSVPLSTTTLPTATVPNLNTDFYGNPRPDASNPTHFDVGAVEFQGAGQGGLLSINPNSGVRGTTTIVTISGTGLTGATAVNVSGGGVACTITGAATATSVTASCVISPTATLSARNVTVTTPTATLGPITFTVVAAATPTLTSISPNSGLRGLAINVTLTGTNFQPTSTVLVEGAPPNPAGFTISGVTYVSATSMTATFTSTAATPLTPINIFVRTGGGDTNSLPYTLTGPVLTSITPTSGNRGTSIAITLTGTGLTGTTAVNVSGGGVTVTGVTDSATSPDTTVTATVTFSAGTTNAARNVTVTTPAGTSNAVTFTVIIPPGDLTSISPNAGARGTSVPVTLNGTNFAGATAVTVSGGGVTTTAPVVTVGGGPGGTSDIATTTLTISPTATLTARNVTITTPAGTSNPVAFTVVSPGTPTLASISPNFGLRGTAVPVTLTGAGFTATGTTVHVVALPAGQTTGLAIGATTIVNSTTITTTFTLSAGATIGPRDIYVTTPGGTTGSVTFAVNGPVLDTISPTQAVRGQTIPVALFGSGLTGTTAINVSGGGITVNTLVVQNDTEVTANFVISSTAGAGARNVTVTAPGGTSNAVPFTVIALSAPTITSIAPTMGVRGSGQTATPAYPAIAVTLTGNNFTGATALTVSGTGVTVTGLHVLSPQTATATFTITAGATVGARNVSITTGSGTGTLTGGFTVLGPTLTAVTPSSGVRGTTGDVITLTGTNLDYATGVTVSGTGVTCTLSGTPTSTSATATCNVTAAAALSARNVSVVTAIGTTPALAGAFTVTGATLTISAPTPTLAPATPNAAGTTNTSTITVTNAATATGAFTFTAAPTTTATAGTANGTFSVTGGTCASGTAVAPGGSCTITVQYVATTTATATAHVTVTGTGINPATQNSANFNAN